MAMSDPKQKPTPETPKEKTNRYPGPPTKLSASASRSTHPLLPEPPRPASATPKTHDPAGDRAQANVHERPKPEAQGSARKNLVDQSPEGNRPG